MHADGKSTLASVSKWNSGKVNYVSKHCCQGTFLKARLLHRILTQPHAQMLSISNMLNKTGNVILNFWYYVSSKENIAYIFNPHRRVQAIGNHLRIFLQSARILSRDIGISGASTRNLTEGKYVHALGWLIDFSIWGESLQNTKMLPNFQNVTNVVVLSNVAILQCFLKIAKCCRVFIKKRVKSLQILQSVAEFYKKKSEKFANVAEPTDVMDLSNIAVLSNVAKTFRKKRQILQSLQIW